ncbi:MAG: hypothetical protein K9G67_12580 [Bacteroidales bacterium]|nr:hypothetical protein [Bacteroidales bacterium]MCF8352288.1 hypothetical protein [Bacteroidales bacterium]MCF8377186.1 hypothetical protein [Bacteroidales bacterium]MCF8401057.1 hypothetical protein [Bacteroidales bacterium]
MEKKRVIKRMENLTGDLMDALKEKYPDGWFNHIIKVHKGNNEFFHAISLELDDTTYLIRVNVKIDRKRDLEKEDNYPPEEMEEGHDDWEKMSSFEEE